MDFYPFDQADERKLAEILRQAESLIAAQTTLAIAADQRAMTFSGLLAASIAGLVGAAATLGVTDPTIVRPLTVVGGLLLLALILALWSARPTHWNSAGNSPANWEDDLVGVQDDLSICNAAMAMYCRNSIAENALSILRAGRAMKASMVITVLALAGALVWQSLRAF